MTREIRISFEDLIKQVDNLSLRELRKLNTSYLKSYNAKSKTKKKIDNRLQTLIMTDLQQHVIDLKINDCCPKCGSKIIVKNGKRSNGVIRLLCKDCQHSFTYFTNTFLDKTRYSWDIWIEVIFHMINHTPLKSLQNILVSDYHCEGIDYKTIFYMR